MNEKILIINVHSSRNLGDAALLNVALQQLYDSFSASKITICMDDPESHHGNEKVIDSIVAWTHPKNKDGTVSWNYWHLIELLPTSIIPLVSQQWLGTAIFAFTPKNLRPIVDAYISADIVVSGPGGFLYSSGRGISLLVTVYSIFMAVFARKPVYIFPQSIGPLKQPCQKPIIHWLLNRVRIVMVREPLSYKLVLTLGVDQSKIHLLPDMAFAIPKADKTVGAEWLGEKGIALQNKEPLLGMTIINWGKQHKGFELQGEYETACAAAVEWFVKSTGGKVILFPQVFGPYLSQDDRIPARRVANQFPELAKSIIVVEQPLALELLKSIYSWMDIFIGTRMHSNIFSLCEGVPVIMIGYLPKTRGLAEMLGIEEWYLDINQVSGNALSERLQQLWTRKNFWTEDRNMAIQKTILDALKAGGIVKEDYERWIQEN
jgi:colanic acid/amylovoran biosynthesis protein